MGLKNVIRKGLRQGVKAALKEGAEEVKKALDDPKKKKDPK